MERSVLVIDDDIILCDAISDYLEPYGFAIKSRGDGRGGLEAASREDLDLILLDVMLPDDLDGLEVLRIIRESSQVPVIMLTARGDEIDRVLGLELGADDYLTKPFSLRELLARVKALLRRGLSQGATRAELGAPAPPPRSVVKSGPFSLDAGLRRLSVGQNEIWLSATQTSILKVLMENPWTTLPRDWLIRAALGQDHNIADRGVDVHMSHIRSMLKKLAPELSPIQTLRGAGYTWIGE
ncbi:MAG: response regulator transcription factor [Deltaproteobacteria bacterium]|jgi:DNA-binding response OmpR family regulator|nr:response regulator transcription factor [Deltaproteobacteria bacterium]